MLFWDRCVLVMHPTCGSLFKDASTQPQPMRVLHNKGNNELKKYIKRKTMTLFTYHTTCSFPYFQHPTWTRWPAIHCGKKKSIRILIHNSELKITYIHPRCQQRDPGWSSCCYHTKFRWCRQLRSSSKSKLRHRWYAGRWKGVRLGKRRSGSYCASKCKLAKIHAGKCPALTHDKVCRWWFNALYIATSNIVEKNRNC